MVVSQWSPTCVRYRARMRAATRARLRRGAFGGAGTRTGLQLRRIPAVRATPAESPHSQSSGSSPEPEILEIAERRRTAKRLKRRRKRQQSMPKLGGSMDDLGVLPEEVLHEEVAGRDGTSDGISGAHALSLPGKITGTVLSTWSETRRLRSAKGDFAPWEPLWARRHQRKEVIDVPEPWGGANGNRMA